MSDGLRARPEVPADVLAAIRDAADQVVAAGQPGHTAAGSWRFSGRWYSAHPTRSRSRPG